jgi:hypothetical protein
LETIDTGGTSLGTYAYHFTITVPSSVVPTISSVTSSPVNDNSVLAVGAFMRRARRRQTSRSMARQAHTDRRSSPTASRPARPSARHPPQVCRLA